MKKVAYYAAVVGLALGLVGLVTAVSTSNFRPTLLFEHIALAADVYSLQLRNLRLRYYELIAVKQRIQEKSLPTPFSLQQEIDLLQDKIDEKQQKIKKVRVE